MEKIILLVILVCSEALYPPPNYKSIVKPSSTYFAQQHARPVGSHYLLQSKEPTYSKTSSQLYATTATTSPIHVTSTQAYSHPYHSSSSSTFSSTPPSPTVSTSYEYIIPSVTPVPQHYVTSVTPQRDELLQVHIHSSAQQGQQHRFANPTVLTDCEHSTTDSNSSPISSIPPSFASILEHNYQNTGEYVVTHTEQHQTTSPSVKTEYEYVIPNQATVSTSTIPAVFSPASEYGVPQNLQTHTPISPSHEIPHVKQPQPIKTNDEYSTFAHSSTQSVSYSTSPTEQQKYNNPVIKTYYEYTIPNVAVAPGKVLPTNQPQSVSSPSPLYTVTQIPQVSTFKHNVPQVENHQPINPSVKTEYKYIIPNPSSLAIASTANTVALDSTASNYNTPHASQTPATEYGSPHIEHQQAVNPPIKTEYEYIIPNSGSVHYISTPTPDLSHQNTNYEYVTSNKKLSLCTTSATETSIPLVSSSSAAVPHVHEPVSGCNIEQPQFIKTEYQYVVPNYLLGTITPAKLNSVHPPASNYDISYVSKAPTLEYGAPLQSTISTPGITHYVPSSVPDVSVSTTKQAGLSIPISTVPQSHFGLPNQSETSTEMKIPIETSYEYTISSDTVSADKTEENKTPEDSSRPEIVPHDEYGVPH